MQWKSSRLAAFTSLLLLSACDLVVAQILAPSCTKTSSFRWSYNSLNQNPCTVGAYLLSTCYGGAFDMAPLGVNIGYAGPSVSEVLEADGCWCNTVLYNLASACSECQGGIAISYSEYTAYCTTILAPSTFPNPVPPGTAVPQWALVTISGSQSWNPSTASRVGDAPETPPGVLIAGPAAAPGGSNATTHTPTTVAGPTDTAALPTSTSHNGIIGPSSNGSNRGAEVAVVVRGVTIMAAIAGLALTLIP